MATRQQCRQGPASSIFKFMRDIRRTYQRAFKALLFLRRFNLSAKPTAPFKQSELGYMFAHPDLFAGVSYYRDPLVSARHNAFFNLNFLPLLDNFHPPQATEDDRVQPSPQRIQAMFDWWERMFDYTEMRRQTRGDREHRVWEVFEEAAENQPDDPAQLLRYMGVDLRHGMASGVELLRKSGDPRLCGYRD